MHPSELGGTVNTLSIIEVGPIHNPVFPDIGFLDQIDGDFCNWYAKVSDGTVHYGATKVAAIVEADAYISKRLN